MFRKKTPDLPGIGFYRTSVRPGDAQFFQRYAPAVEHPEEVVVWDQEQFGGVGKGDVVRVPPGIGVTVGADDGQVSDLAVQTAGDLPLGGVAGEKPILVHDDGSSHHVFLPSFNYGRLNITNRR